MTGSSALRVDRSEDSWSRFGRKGPRGRWMSTEGEALGGDDAEVEMG